MKKSVLHRIAGLSILVLASLATGAAVADSPIISLYHNPGCMCCEQYGASLQKTGYKVKIIDTNDIAGFNKKHGVRPEFSSCHTSLVGKYVVVGHVPPEAIAKLLRQRPDLEGITLPGMPAGSLGMPGIKDGPFVVRTLDGGVYGRF